jgi:hypothetical protein
MSGFEEETLGVSASRLTAKGDDVSRREEEGGRLENESRPVQEMYTPRLRLSTLTALAGFRLNRFFLECEILRHSWH